jgi:HK97 gp10 family phage protein
VAETTHIAGLAELHRMLQELPGKVEGNVMRGALRAGMKEFEREAVRRVPVKHGDLRDSIKIRFKAKSQKFGWVRMQLVAGGKKAWYSHLIEFGTASFYTGKGKSARKPYTIKPKKRGGALFFGGTVRAEVVHPGIKPQPFMRPAADAGQGPALDATVKYIRTRLPKEFKKAGK